MRYVYTALLALVFFTNMPTIRSDNEIARSGCCATLDCNNGNSGLCKPRCSTCHYNCGITTFIPRSQGANTARELIGWQFQLYQPYYIENYTTLAFTTEYTRSYKPEHIANTLFCTDCLTFAGSQAQRNNGVDIIADYFGLPTDFKGTLSIKPFIENYILDFNLYFGLNELLPGLYLRIHAPLTHTKWSLGLDECVACAGKFRGHDQFPTGYMYSATAPTPPGSDVCYINNAVDPNVIITPITTNSGQGQQDCTTNQSVPYNCTTHSLREALSGEFTFGDMTERWKYGRFSFCGRNKTALADVDIILGYNFIESDLGHFGLYLQAVAPTGNRPKARYIFEPIAGNGKHWELGVGISTHITLYDDNLVHGYSAGFYLEGNVTNVFKTEQKRSFDFTKNGRLSRYMLLKEFDVDNLYIGRMINAINFATRNAEIHVGYKADLSAKLALTFGGWMTDIGYNFYARSAETVCIKTECPCDIDQRRFGIKGTTGVCSSSYAVNNSVIPAMAMIPDTGSLKDSTTQPNATMFAINTNPSLVVPEGVASLTLAYNSNALTVDTPTADLIPANGFIVSNAVFASGVSAVNPVILSCCDLDPNSAAQSRMLTHKVFGHIGYLWEDFCFQPHIGLGAEVEIDGREIHNALSQWGIWLKGGLTF